jgi:hypothetical protein
MNSINFRLRFDTPSLDEAVATVGDMRLVASLLPFAVVSPISLAAGPPTRIGFVVGQGNGWSPMPISVIGRGPVWSGAGSFQVQTEHEADQLIAHLRAFLTVISWLDYAQVSDLLVGVDDSTNFWESRSLPRLVRALCGGDDLPGGLSDRMRSFLLGIITTTLGPDEEPHDGLAVEPLEVLLDIIDQESVW